MAKNPDNKEGVFLEPPAQDMMSVGASGWTEGTLLYGERRGYNPLFPSIIGPYAEPKPGFSPRHVKRMKPNGS